KRTHYFKYLGELITENNSKKRALQARAHKLEMAYHRKREVYKKKSVFIKAKLRHYCTVIRSEALYAAECITLKGKGLVEKLALKERKILKTILGP
uniref:hypothetical protein n=1 Tax=Deinococcus sp. TaxID=47478 RepID=UPI0025BA8F92